MKKIINIKPQNTITVGDLIEFAREHPLPKSRKSTEEILKEIDKELWGYFVK